MVEVIGVRFKETGKIYYFDPNEKEAKKGEYVIVETARGIECGEVAMENRMVEDDTIISPLKKVLRLATVSHPLLLKVVYDVKDTMICDDLYLFVLVRDIRWERLPFAEVLVEACCVATGTILSL